MAKRVKTPRRYNSPRRRERAGGLMEVIRAAAAVDANVGALWSRIEAEFYDNQRAIVLSLDEKKVLKADLDVAGAADILWTLNHPDVYRLLVNERGWPPER